MVFTKNCEQFDCKIRGSQPKRKKIPSQAKQCTQNNGVLAKKMYLWYGSYLSDLDLNQDNDVDARPSKCCPHWKEYSTVYATCYLVAQYLLYDRFYMMRFLHMINIWCVCVLYDISSIGQVCVFPCQKAIQLPGPPASGSESASLSDCGDSRMKPSKFTKWIGIIPIPRLSICPTSIDKWSSPSGFASSRLQGSRVPVPVRFLGSANKRRTTPRPRDSNLTVIDF